MLRVLLVTDRVDLAEVLRDDPGRQEYRFEQRSHDLIDVDDVVREFEIVVVDLDTTPDGVSLGRSLRAKKREVEVIAVASPDRERQAVEALKAGAFDYQLWPPTEAHDFWTLVARCVKKLAPAPPAPFPRPFGHFTLLKRLGAGGMAEVFLAEIPKTPTSPPRAVVIKQMLPNLAGDDEFVRMFMDEVRISSALVHPNIVRVTDFGRQGDTLYMTMEWVPGRNLEELRHEVNGPFPPGLACHIVAEICAGLGHAHRKVDRNGAALGIVHRDVNPPNVLVADDGRVMLMDFGIAKAAHRYYETTSGVLKGKFEYMSPEQAHGHRIDHRADIFSVGLILYELLAAARPFQAATPVETLFLIQECNPRPPSVHEPRIPAALDRIVMKALARDLPARYQSASELENDLREFARKTSNPGPSDVAAFAKTMLSTEPSVDAEDHTAGTVPGIVPAPLAATGEPTAPGAGPIPRAPANEQTRAPDKIPMGAVPRPWAAAPSPASPPPVPSGFRGAAPAPASLQTPTRENATVAKGKVTIIGPLPTPAGGVPIPERGTDIVRMIQSDLEKDLSAEPTITNPEAALPVAPPAPPDREGTVIRQGPPMAASVKPGVVPEVTNSEGSATLFPGSARRADRQRRAMQVGGVVLASGAVVALAFPLLAVIRGLGDPAAAPTPYVVAVATPPPPNATATAPAPVPETSVAVAASTPAVPAVPAATVAIATPATAPVTPRATPVVVAAVTQRPTPRPAAAKGTLSIWVDGWATVEIDGKQLPQPAPFVGVPVSAGKHTLTYYNQWARRETTVTIKPNAETKLTLDLKN